MFPRISLRVGVFRILIDSPAYQAFDVPLDGHLKCLIQKIVQREDMNLRHGVASVVQPPPVLLMESLAERMSDWLVVSGVHSPADVLGGVWGGPGGAGHGA